VKRLELQKGQPWFGWHDKAHRGVWKGGRRDGSRTAIVSCPTCGMSFSLSGHTIKPNGDVNPSLACTAMSCAFHEHVRLVGWSPRP
jgi:hypothetical protein